MCLYHMAPEPKYHFLTLKAGEISAALGIDESYIAAASEPALINAGLNTLIVPIAGLSVCLAIKPDELKLKTFCLDNGIDIVLVFTQETAGKGHDYRTARICTKIRLSGRPGHGLGKFSFRLLSA